MEGESGLLAGDQTTRYESSVKCYAEQRLKNDIERHFTWGTRNWSSPFISLFSDWNHARNWAIKRPWKRRGNWEILEIDTSCLDGVYVFKLSTIVNKLDACIPKGADTHIKDGYIALHMIPSRAIVKRHSEVDVV